MSKIKTDYKIGDVVFCITNGSLIKTKIIKLYRSHVGVYSGDHFIYGRSYSDVAETLEGLAKQITCIDYTKQLPNY